LRPPNPDPNPNPNPDPDPNPNPNPNPSPNPNQVRHFAGDVCYISAAAQAKALGGALGSARRGSVLTLTLTLALALTLTPALAWP